MIDIRFETPRDIQRVHDINEKAFGQPAEADLVDRLRRSCPDAISLVAEEDGLIVGHIMFTPVFINDRERKIRGMGLAPMAVQPRRQRQGIGSRLAEKGLEILRDRGCPYVIVLGHPEYYPRFGFEPASRYGIKSQWEGIPDEAFLILVFNQNTLQNVKGVTRYRNEFNEAMVYNSGQTCTSALHGKK